MAQGQKIRKSLVVFLKGSASPVALYVKDPEADYRELQALLKMPTARVIEKETTGPIKRISFPSNHINAVAIQEEVIVG